MITSKRFAFMDRDVRDQLAIARDLLDCAKKLATDPDVDIEQITKDITRAAKALAINAHDVTKEAVSLIEDLVRED